MEIGVVRIVVSANDVCPQGKSWAEEKRFQSVTSLGADSPGEDAAFASLAVEASELQHSLVIPVEQTAGNVYIAAKTRANGMPEFRPRSRIVGRCGVEVAEIIEIQRSVWK